MNESPLFIRTYDFLLWLVPQIQKFPRTYRFTLSERIQRLALSFQDSLIAAGKTKGRSRFEHLQQADVQLEQLRLWLRFSRDKDLLTIQQYEHSIRQLKEVGNLLGAWLKQA
jgi:four helix bundle protein